MSIYTDKPAVTPGKIAAQGGLAGAIVGGAVSAARNMKRFKENQISKDEAFRNTAKEAAGSGIATAAGFMAAGSLGLAGFGGLLVAMAASTGVKYLWDDKMAARKTRKVEDTASAKSPDVTEKVQS